MEETVTRPAAPAAVSGGPADGRREAFRWPVIRRPLAELPLVHLAALAVLIPFVVVIIRAFVSPPRGAIWGDYAVMNLQVRQAVHWQLLLGVYDRFGWHHPGPVYLYLMSFVERFTGGSRAVQAQITTAALVDGLSAWGAVVLIGRVHGRRAALATEAVIAATIALIGPMVIDDPWTPHVVILPLVLLGTVAASAAAGSTAGLAGSLLLGSVVVQADVGTLPAVALMVAVGVLFWGFGRWRARIRPSGSHPVVRHLPIALLGATGLVWVPTLVEQATAWRGNLTAIWDFFTSHHVKFGPLGAASLAGRAAGAAFGLAPPSLIFQREPGLREFLLVLAIELVVVLVAAWRLGTAPPPAPLGLALVALAGTFASWAAAGSIYGMTWEYLVAWAVAPAVLALLALGVLAASNGRANVVVAVAALTGTAFLIAACSRAPLPPMSTPYVGPATAAVVAHDPGHQTVGVVADGWDPLAVMDGMADQLAAHGIHYSVPSDLRFMFPGNHGEEPSVWAVIATPGSDLPAGYQVVMRTPSVVVAMGSTRPPGWR